MGIAINACVGLKDYEQGIKIYQNLNDSQIEQSIQIKNALIRFYGYCSPHNQRINNALNIFDKINDDEKDLFSFGTMMSVYIENNDYKNALKLYDEIESNALKTKYENILANNQITHLLALKACANLRDLEKGKEIHSKYGREYLRNVSFQTALISLYSKCGDIKQAKNIFDAMDNKSKDYQTMCVMMTAYNDHKQYQNALDLYNLILSDNKNQARDNAVIYLMAIKACTHLNNLEKLESVSRRFVKYEHLFEEHHKTQIQNTLKQ